MIVFRKYFRSVSVIIILLLSGCSSAESEKPTSVELDIDLATKAELDTQTISLLQEMNKSGGLQGGLNELNLQRVDQFHQILNDGIQVGLTEDNLRTLELLTRELADAAGVTVKEGFRVQIITQNQVDSSAAVNASAGLDEPTKPAAESETEPSSSPELPTATLTPIPPTLAPTSIPPTPAPTKVEQLITINPETSERLCPDHIQGDRDFAGNGPVTIVYVDLYISHEGELRVRYVLNAHESGSDGDGSTTYGDWDRLLYTPPPGFWVDKILTISSEVVEYTDTNHDEDIFMFEGAAFREIRIMGDTEGDDLGNCTEDDTYLIVDYDQIAVVIREK